MMVSPEESDVLFSFFSPVTRTFIVYKSGYSKEPPVEWYYEPIDTQNTRSPKSAAMWVPCPSARSRPRRYR